MGSSQVGPAGLEEGGILVLEQKRGVLQRGFANDCSSREMCRMDGEGAGKRERLVTDTLNRWEVLSSGRAVLWKCRAARWRGDRAKGQCGDLTQKHWVGTEVKAPCLVVELWGTRRVRDGKGAVQMGETIKS